MTMKINGVELPEEFNGCSSINNIAVTKDGTKYAVVRDGSFETREMPADGKLNIDGNKIQYTRHSKGVRISSEGSIMSMGGLNFNNSSINIGKNMKIKEMENERIEKEYELIDLVHIDNTYQSINLGSSKNDKVKVKGSAESVEDKVNLLKIDCLEGLIELPEEKDVFIEIESTTGNVTGKIMHPGSIETSTGRISLDVHVSGLDKELYVESGVGNVEINLYVPSLVHVSTSIGQIKVNGMAEVERNEDYKVFVPSCTLFAPFQVGVPKVKGKLTVETSTGNITINYKGPTSQESKSTQAVQEPVEEVKVPKKKRHNPEITEEDRRKWERK